MKTVQEWMLTTGCVERVVRAPRYYVSRSNMENVFLLVVKVSDDFLVVGDSVNTKWFVAAPKYRFVVDIVSNDLNYCFNDFEFEVKKILLLFECTGSGKVYVMFLLQSREECRSKRWLTQTKYFNTGVLWKR